MLLNSFFIHRPLGAYRSSPPLQLSAKTGCAVTDIEKLCIWGNHSASMYPDIAHATIKGKDAAAVLNDEAWYKKTFIPTVAQVRLAQHNCNHVEYQSIRQNFNQNRTTHFWSSIRVSTIIKNKCELYSESKFSFIHCLFSFSAHIHHSLDLFDVCLLHPFSLSRQRGAAIIAARGLSSAASAGGSAIDHIRDWANGTQVRFP